MVTHGEAAELISASEVKAYRAGDLWRYHLEDLKKAGLLDELREHLETLSKQKGNEWMRHDTRADKDLWHDLVRILERVRR